MDIFRDDTSCLSTSHSVSPFIDTGNILKLQEKMKAGESLSIEPPLGRRLVNVKTQLKNNLTLLKDEKGLLYWFTIEGDGRFRVTGKVIKDKAGFFRQMQEKPSDSELRRTLIDESLAKSVKRKQTIKNVHEGMMIKNTSPHPLYRKSWLLHTEMLENQDQIITTRGYHAGY